MFNYLFVAVVWSIGISIVLKQKRRDKTTNELTVVGFRCIAINKINCSVFNSDRKIQNTLHCIPFPLQLKKNHHVSSSIHNIILNEIPFHFFLTVNQPNPRKPVSTPAPSSNQTEQVLPTNLYTSSQGTPLHQRNYCWPGPTFHWWSPLPVCALRMHAVGTLTYCPLSC